MRLLVGYDGSDGGRDALGLTRVLSGMPGPTIAETCGEVGADLLVAGSRGYGPVMRVLLGSVSTQLLHKAPCPVLVVPRPEKGGEGP